MLKNALRHIKLNKGIMHDENQYIRLDKDILSDGEMVVGRNGSAKTVIGSAMHFSLKVELYHYLQPKK